MEEAIKMDALVELRNLMGDSLDDVLQTYIDYIPGQIEELDQAWRAEVGGSDTPTITPVLENAAAEFLRAKVAELEEADRDDERQPLVERAPDPAPSVLDRVVADDLVASVERAMRALPLEFREVLLLRFQEGLELREIARILRRPLSTVKTRLYRGLEQLRQRMERSIRHE